MFYLCLKKSDKEKGVKEKDGGKGRHRERRTVTGPQTSMPIEDAGIASQRDPKAGPKKDFQIKGV